MPFQTDAISFMLAYQCFKHQQEMDAGVVAQAFGLLVAPYIPNC